MWLRSQAIAVATRTLHVAARAPCCFSHACCGAGQGTTALEGILRRRRRRDLFGPRNALVFTG
eukprot:8374879-Pyramimonas_sp.AAC.1